MDEDNKPLIRWHATAYYRTEQVGPIEIHHDLKEIGDLHDLIEHGPHWDTIERIEIVRVNHCDSEKLTIEQSKRLGSSPIDDEPGPR